MITNEADGWRLVAERIDDGRDEFLCLAIRKAQNNGEISSQVGEAMMKRAYIVLNGAWLAYPSIDGEDTAARVLAALVFAEWAADEEVA